MTSLTDFIHTATYENHIELINVLLTNMFN